MPEQDETKLEELKDAYAAAEAHEAAWDAEDAYKAELKKQEETKDVT